ncbi:hypothetical protein OHT52_17175 [Streptomyces sp. NBC_00247]|uniref:hypothetical protein n=1 Tax=Streptomyces sp. NBC_00247 TaxID=2975689 RepID=UPI002E2C4963|nr:hypothetical protein [Streptomyces sp. NBC_00247]
MTSAILCSFRAGVLSGVLTVGGPHADHEWTDVARMPERAALVARMVELLLREG